MNPANWQDPIVFKEMPEYPGLLGMFGFQKSMLEKGIDISMIPKEAWLYAYRNCILDPVAVLDIAVRIADGRLNPNENYNAIKTSLSTLQQMQEWSNYICETPKQAKVIEDLRAASATRWIIICGYPGTGKGHVAAAIAKDKIKIGKKVVFTTCYEMLGSCAADGLKERGVVEFYKSADLLVIDEFEKAGNLTEAKAAAFFEIINNACEYFKQIIIITNMAWEMTPQILEKYSDEFMDRITERGTVFTFDWPSKRPENRQMSVFPF